MTHAQIAVAAHRLNVHTTVVTEAYQSWRFWCEKEGVDPEVMDFERWLTDMESLAGYLRRER
jgi:LPS sulfotransferase NodH